MVIAALLGWAIPAQLAYAQQPKTPPKEEPKQQKEEPKPAPAPGALTVESLKEMLDTLGYDIEKERKDEKGNVFGYQLKVNSAKYGSHPCVSLSVDGTNLWFTQSLGKVPDPASVPTKILLNMLSANDLIYPVSFCYGEKFNNFYIVSMIANKGVKPKDMRQRIDQLTSVSEGYDHLWNPAKWESKKTAANK